MGKVARLDYYTILSVSSLADGSFLLSLSSWSTLFLWFVVNLLKITEAAAR
jgi:hypothetical protein